MCLWNVTSICDWSGRSYSMSEWSGPDIWDWSVPLMCVWSDSAMCTGVVLV